MGNYDKTFNTICRVCLKHDKLENMVSLTNSENGLSLHGQSFEKLSKISVQSSEFSPTKLCHLCKKALDDVISFQNRINTSDKRLKKLITFSLSQDLTGEMVKEVVCQYTLFSQYFPEECEKVKRSAKPSPSRARTSELHEIRSFTTQNSGENENSQYSSIKVEVQVEPTSQSDSDNDFLMDDSNVVATLNDSDSVDLFLDSIEKLVSSKLQHHDSRRIKKEMKQKETVCNLTCNICHKTLANRATFENHMQRHGGCRFMCDQCGKGFPVLAELTQHQITRHGIGPYLECDYCSFKAPRRIELIEHIRLHTGERPFTCDKCGLTFRRKAIWTNHLKCHNEKSVPCQYCPRKFYRRSEMLTHCNNVHDRRYLYLCHICNVTYAKPQTVRKHMCIKHGIPREMQGKVVRVNKEANSSLFRESNKIGENEYGDIIL